MDDQSYALTHKGGKDVLRYIESVFLIIVICALSVLITACSSKQEASSSTEVKESGQAVKEAVSDDLSKKSQKGTSLMEAIKEYEIFPLTESPITLSQGENFFGVFESGKVFYISGGNYIQKYVYNGEGYEVKEKLAGDFNSDYSPITAIVSEDGSLYAMPDINNQPLDDFLSFHLTNAMKDVAFCQADRISSNQTENLIYKGSLTNQTWEKIDSNVILEKLVDVESDRKTAWLTMIALADGNSLAHVFLCGEENLSKSTSIWAIFDKEYDIVKKFETSPFDKLSNIQVSPDGRYVAFSYSQTPGMPQVLNLEEEIVQTIESQDDVQVNFDEATILFINWQNSDKLCLGILNEDRSLVTVAVKS